jgi:signal transduction histidine kinase
MMSLRTAAFAGCPLLIALIGYVDFRRADENSMLLFYMIPIAVSTWYCGTPFGIAMVAFSVTAAVLADRLAGIAGVGTWNVAMSTAYYLVFIALLSRWHDLVEHMHAKVEERTAELQREISARRELEREVANVTEQERARLGRQLHDSLCQHLTGTALKAQTVVRQVQRRDQSAATNAADVVSLLDRGIDIARDIARGLFSSELEGEGLVAAMEALAETTTRQHGLDCGFEHSAELAISSEKATHLYWITREAVANAVRHGQPKQIQIRLMQAGQHAQLDVEDDGCGLAPYIAAGNGVGLRIMRQRAELAGGSLRVSEGANGGTSVRCVIPVDRARQSRESNF